MSELEVDASLMEVPPPAADVNEPAVSIDAPTEAPPPADDTPPVEEPQADPPAEPVKQHHGAVKELVENRRLLKEANARLAQLEGDPVLQRLTPDVRAAIAEGRVVIKPHAIDATNEQRKQSLEATAKRLNLYKVGADGRLTDQLDLDAAQNVQAEIRSIVGEHVAPLQNQTLQDKANANIRGLWESMAQQKVSAEVQAVVEQEFKAVMGQANAAQLLANPEVAQTIYDRAIGRAVREGKFTAGAVPPKTTTPPANPPPAGGRRGATGSAIRLSPAVAAVYAQHKLDPDKGYSATNELKYDKAGNIELE